MIKKIFLFLTLAIIIWISGFIYFIYSTNRYVLDNSTITDAIVVFSGKQQRIYTAAALLKATYAPIVHVAGNKPSSAYDNYLKSQNLAPEQFVFAEFALDKNRNFARDTVEFIHLYGISSIRLITSALQMPRAVDEIKSLSPQTVIIPHPVSRKGLQFRVSFIEYNKLILFFVYKNTSMLKTHSLSYE